MTPPLRGIGWVDSRFSVHRSTFFFLFPNIGSSGTIFLYNSLMGAITKFSFSIKVKAEYWLTMSVFINRNQNSGQIPEFRFLIRFRNRLFDPSTPSLRKGRDWKKMENSDPLTLLPFNRLVVTDCNARANNWCIHVHGLISLCLWFASFSVLIRIKKTPIWFLTSTTGIFKAHPSFLSTWTGIPAE